MPSLVLLLLSLCLPALADEQRQIERELAGIVDLFYDHDFDRAQLAAAQLENRHPGHPAGPIFRALVDYQRWVAEGLRGDGWTPVERNLERGLTVAKGLKTRSPAEFHYYLGAALGFRARGLAAQKKYIRALPDAASALSHLKKALALDPSLHDARLGLGMYHYFAARMPAGAKPFARLLVGEPGDREKGLSELWTVAESSSAGRMEARSVLSMILAKDDEANYEKSEDLLAELMPRYPRNPVYRLRRAYVAQRRGRAAEAARWADPEGEWLAKLHPVVRPRARAQALLRSGELALLAGRRAEAEKFLGALDDSLLPNRTRDWARMRRANLRDLAGDRAGALAEYKALDDRGPATLSKSWLKEPFPAGPRDPSPYFAGY